MFLHLPETHVSSPGPAPSPGAGVSPGQEEQHHVLAIFNIPLKEAPGGAALGWLRFEAR